MVALAWHHGSIAWSLCHFSFKPLQYGCLQTPLTPSHQDLTFWADSGYMGVYCLWTHLWVPILQSPQEPERAGEARRAESASNYKLHWLKSNEKFINKFKRICIEIWQSQEQALAFIGSCWASLIWICSNCNGPKWFFLTAGSWAILWLALLAVKWVLVVEL